MPDSNLKAATHSNHSIPVSIEDLRGFMKHVLEAEDWRDIKAPRDLKQIMATQEEERSGHSKWHMQFTLKIKYREDKAKIGHTVLEYSITEKKGLGLNTAQKLLSQLIKSTDELVKDYLETRAGQVVPTTYGSAKFADEAELRQQGYILSSVPAKQLLLAPWGEKEFIVVPERFTYMHALVCGPNGSGKSSGFFIPNILHRTGSSAVITEATVGSEIPSLFRDTAGLRQQKGSKVYFFNPDMAKGTRINPIDLLKTASEDEFPQLADELANLIILNTTPPGTQRTDPIWDKSEKHLLWIMIMHVAQGKENANFGAVREIARKHEKQIQAILKNSPSEIAREEFDSFLSHSSENFRHGVFAGLLQRLNPWLSSVVHTMTAATDLDFAQFTEENFSFYLSVPSDKHHVKPIAALIFNFLFSLFKNKTFKHPPALFLDEFTNFGAIPGIQDKLSIVRKAHLPVVLGFQNQSQLSTLYGHVVAKAIVSELSTRVFFRPRTAEDAKALSDALDDTTIVDRRTDDRGNTSIREMGRALMTVRDVLTLPPEEVIIMTESTNPIKTKRFDHITCPPRRDLPLPELVEHPLLKVERISQTQVLSSAKNAKDEAQKSNDFRKVKKDISDIIAAAEINYDLKPVALPPADTEPDIPPEDLSRKPKKPKYIDPDDDFDIPG